jgi:6-phosphogluconolactonase
MRGTLVICADLERLCQEAAARMARAIQSTAECFTLALAGGSTPRRLYELLSSCYRDQVPWQKVHLFWGDERLVPPDHPESNYRMAREKLLRWLLLPEENVHPVRLLPSFEETAAAYEKELREFFGEQRRSPVFDLILLGLGADGHTASLFPRADALEEKERAVLLARSPVGTVRVTLTLPVLNAARRIFFLVSGAEKARILRRVLEEKGDLPAQRVAPLKGELVWLVDHAAASELGPFKEKEEVQVGGLTRRRAEKT